MNTQTNTNPTDVLIEAVATVLVQVGGYKDAAEAVRAATELVEDFASPDSQVSLAAAMELRTLTIQAQGASNYQAALTNDDADQSVRFVADEGESLPEGPLNGETMSFDDAIKSVLTSVFPGVQFDVGPLPEETGKLEFFTPNPFGGFTRVG